MAPRRPRSAAVYTRAPRDDEGHRTPLRRQEADSLQFADERGWKVADVYADTRNTRPEYRRMLADIVAGRIDGVIVWHLDLLTRQSKELRQFFEIAERAGIALATVTGDVDLSTTEGQQRARILGEVASEEAERRSRGVRQAHERLAREGRDKGGGTRAFGFRDDQVHHEPSEVRLIRKAARDVLDGRPLRTIAQDWDRRGIVTPTGKEWTPGRLRDVLISPRMAGLRSWHGEVVAEAEWKPIIPRAEWEDLRALLTDPSRKKFGSPTARRYLLTGLARCGLCGAELTGHPRSSGQRGYVCRSGPRWKGCGKIRIAAVPVENAIIPILFREWEKDWKRERRTPKAGADKAVDELSRIEGQLAELAKDFYADRGLSRAEYLAAKTELDRRAADARARIADHADDQPPPPWKVLFTDAERGGSDDLADDPERLDRWRVLAARSIRSVVVGPAAKRGPGVDVSRVTIELHDGRKVKLG